MMACAHRGWKLSTPHHVVNTKSYTTITNHLKWSSFWAEVNQTQYTTKQNPPHNKFSSSPTHTQPTTFPPNNHPKPSPSYLTTPPPLPKPSNTYYHHPPQIPTAESTLNFASPNFQNPYTLPLNRPAKCTEHLKTSFKLYSSPSPRI